MRICADYSTGLNSQLQDHRYPIPVIEDIYAAIGPRKYYSIIDVRDAYFQVEVAEECRHFLTINTHRGLYTMNRLPQGIKPAATIFQQMMETVINKMPQVFPYIDDVIVASDSLEEHINQLKQVITRLNDYGFSLSLEKSQFFKTELKCLGFIISQEGLKPDPDQLKIIQSLPSPTNESELRSLLGSLNFYQRFIKNMAVHRAPLDALLKKDVPFNWSAQCEAAFQKFKEILATAQLCHYNAKLPIVVAADASNQGLGACIMHRFPDGNLKTIKCESRSLAPAEKNYSQIEKEALAIIWGIEKFHKYIYGRRFILQTDHRPLITIYGSKRGVSAHASNRLLRWGLKLNCYDFDINTKQFGYVDMLSRLIPKNNNPEDLVVANIRLVEESQVLQATAAHLPVSFKDIKAATLEDNTMQLVKSYIQTEWPDGELSWELKELRRRREGLAVVDEVITFNDRIVVPFSLQQAVLDELHGAHAGINTTKTLARSYVYWPGMDDQITNLVKTCPNCLRVGNAPTKNFLHSWPKCDRPWQRIHIDYAEKDGRNYLIRCRCIFKIPGNCLNTNDNSQQNNFNFEGNFCQAWTPQHCCNGQRPTIQERTIL